MKFIQRLTAFIHKIDVLINTPRPNYGSTRCTNINMLLMHLCDFNREQYCYILQWLAYPLRHPGAKMCYGLVINGEQNTGLNLFFQHVAVAVHQGHARIVHAGVLSDRLQNIVAAPLVVVDGAITARTIERVKVLMASESVSVKRKDYPVRSVSNGMNFILLSGDMNMLPAAGMARRFMVMEAPPARDRAFYQAVESEIKDGGIDAFRDFLRRGIDMDGFNETTVPPGFERAAPSEPKAGSLRLVREPA